MKTMALTDVILPRLQQARVASVSARDRPKSSALTINIATVRNSPIKAIYPFPDPGFCATAFSLSCPTKAKTSVCAVAPALFDYAGKHAEALFTWNLSVRYFCPEFQVNPED
jgi:hypothetical protein